MRPKYIVVGDQPGAWQWRLVAEDGQPVARSIGSFRSPAAAARAAQAARQAASGTAGPAEEPPAAEPDPAAADQSMDVVIRRLVQASRDRTAG
jgi:hypothetical protein